MKIRLLAPQWVGFTGYFGQIEFKDGVSVNDLHFRQVGRIAATTTCVDAETDEPVGPSVVSLNLPLQTIPVIEQTRSQEVVQVEQADAREKLATENALIKAEEKAALADAQAKAAAAVDEIVIYSRLELEAIASNDGITGLREIAMPLGVKGRSIGEMVNAILAAQAEKAVV